MVNKRSFLLEIAGIRIRVSGSPEDLFTDPGPLVPYCTAGDSWEHDYAVHVTDRLELPAEEPVFRADNQMVFLQPHQTIRLTGPVGGGAAAAHVRISRCGPDVSIDYLRTEYLQYVTPRLLLNALDLEHLLTIHRGFLLHACYVAVNGKAVLFTAPSGTGKSTQGQLWCENRGAELINGDRAAVRIMDSGVHACGVPFSGSSDVRKNVVLPLAAIVYLTQAPENTIARLRGVRAFRRIWEGCSVNLWDRTDLDLATRTVSDTIANVPVYHLACTPDIRAVELLESALEADL